MLRWSLLFLVVSLVAALFGFTQVAGESVAIARVLFFVFLVLFALSFLIGRGRPRELT